MADITTNTVVVGAGPGGYVAAIRLGQLGVKTLVIEKENLGGVCLNVGCIPSKALIHAAKLAEKIQHAEDYGISVGNYSVDMKKMQTWKAGIVKKLTGGVGQLCKANGADTMKGTASFVDDHTLSVKSKNSTKTVRFDHAIIATGSRPFEVPGFAFDGQHILSSTDALALTKIPESMLVIGGGYIGLELGTVYAKLGTKVTVVEMMDSILPTFEKDIVQILKRKLKKLGIEVKTNTKALSFDKKSGKVTVHTEDSSGKKGDITVEKVLVAVGRKPVLDGFGLDTLKLEMQDGFIKVDDERRTSKRHIFAIGDVAGQPLLAHKASYEGEVAAEVIAGKAAFFDPGAIPAVVFTDPEIASTGLTETEAKEAGYDVVAGKFPFAALGRALTVNDTDGFVKVIGDRESGVVLGLHIIGNGASDLISEGTAAIELGSTLEDLSLSIHPHPTLSEGVMEAAKAALGAAIHTVNK